MSFGELALIGLIGLLGPLLALPKRLHLPVVLGELAAGVVVGASGFGIVDASQETFGILADVGFALVMFVAGTHLPVRARSSSTVLVRGAVRAVLVGLVAVAFGVALARLFDLPHWSLYAVLIGSSSAALVLPTLDSLGLSGPKVGDLLPQVAIADAVCIVALPLAIDPAHAPRAALGALAVVATAAVMCAILWWLEHIGVRRRVHEVSERRRFALELRIQLVLLCAIAAVAVGTHVSIMLAGFTFGLAVNIVGEPRRLAKQLFALTEGFFGPLFFVWLGASLQLRNLGQHPSMLLLGVLLGLGSVLAHLAPRLLGQPIPLGLMAAAQIGVPSAAVTIGTQEGLLRAGEGSALMLGALVTIAFSVVGGALAARSSAASAGVPSPGQASGLEPPASGA
ncbi:cation:proton antiporter [Nocardioides sp.]|uniref:cation:proton antiporter n=1 Tax=Nocardioides sp. TaxID=35761 RepID=UPI002611460E|nr:cation:proton antiporter [Nocardioides sp.]